MLRLFVTYSKVLIHYIIMIKDTIHNRGLHIYTYYKYNQNRDT